MAETKRPAIDWDEVKARLIKAGEHLADTARQDPLEILRKRARLFAPPAREQVEEEGIQAVVFMLGKERFALESAYLTEVSEATEIVPVPCTPSFVLGIVNLRGEVLSIIDLRKFFDLPERGLSDMNRLLVLSSGQMRFGVLADAVEGVRQIRAEGLKKLPTLSGLREEYLLGVSPEGITVLDGGRLLADGSIIVYEKVD